MKHWFKQLGIAVDQLINVLITPLHPEAWADETLSSRAYRMYMKKRPWGLLLKPLIDALFSPLEKDHCYKAFVSEREGRQLPPEAR